MRGIKFRAWNDTEKLMVDLQKITPLALSDSINTQMALQGMGGVFLPFSPKIKIMQYTGLKDKNGKEIYEGDVVLFGDNIIHSGTHGKVIWHESKVGFVYEFIDGQYQGKCTDMVDTWRSYEIIGNIYENPELLNKPPSV